MLCGERFTLCNVAILYLLWVAYFPWKQVDGRLLQTESVETRGIVTRLENQSIWRAEDTAAFCSFVPCFEMDDSKERQA